MIPLAQVCDYSVAATSVSNLNLSTYVTTDNLLPNRGGIVDATNLPPARTCPKFERDNILLSNIRPYFKKIWYATFEGGCSTDVMVLKCKNDKYYPRFVYYSLFQDLFFRHMMNGAKGSKMPRGDKDQIMEFEIPDFEKPYQIRIADLLTSLDDKISLNARINAELEQMARTIYNYWFVQFDFPISAAQAASMGKPELEGKPYKSSGGEMVWNEELKREVPRRWEVESLVSLAKIIMGQSPSSDSYNKSNIGLPLVNGAADYKNGLIVPEIYTSTPTRVCTKDDMVFCIRATIGNLTHAEGDYCLGRSVAAVRPKLKELHEIIYYALDMEMETFKRQAAGSIIVGITKEDLEQMKVLVPDHKSIAGFHDLCSKIFLKIRLNYKETVELTSLRDFLLPLLMNGEVRVGDQKQKKTI